MDMEVVLGDDTVVRAVGRGIVCFERESMQPMFLRDVICTWAEEEPCFSFHD